jgi:hypothetical protein
MARKLAQEPFNGRTLKERKVCPDCNEERPISEFRYSSLFSLYDEDGEVAERCAECHGPTTLRQVLKTGPACGKSRSLLKFNARHLSDQEEWARCCGNCIGKAKKRGNYLKKKYRLTVREYLELLVKQEGACAICRGRPVGILHLDHCHNTMKNRGLLCARCNMGLGLLKHDPARLRAAALYLEQYAK